MPATPVLTLAVAATLLGSLGRSLPLKPKESSRNLEPLLSSLASGTSGAWMVFVNLAFKIQGNKDGTETMRHRKPQPQAQASERDARLHWPLPQPKGPPAGLLGGPAQCSPCPALGPSPLYTPGF